MRVRISFGTYEIALRPGESLIGRTRTCHLRVDDPTVSRRHARLLLVRDIITVADLGSRNGVQVNGTKIVDAHPLADGDVVAVGACIFNIHIDMAAPAEEPNDEIEEVTQLPNDAEYQVPIYRTCISCRGMLKKTDNKCTHCGTEQNQTFVTIRVPAMVPSVRQSCTLGLGSSATAGSQKKKA